MKRFKKLTILSLGVLSLGLFAQMPAQAAQITIAANTDQAQAQQTDEMAWWRKKDEIPEESPAPEQNPNANPSPHSNKPEEQVPSPAPAAPSSPAKNQSTDASFIFNGEEYDDLAILEVFSEIVRYSDYSNYRNNPSQGTQGGAQGGATQQNQQNHQYSQFLPGIADQIHNLATHQNKISVHPEAYIVQQEDGLWLIMGNMRAKLDILIYVDQKNMNDTPQTRQNNTQNYSIPIYR